MVHRFSQPFKLETHHPILRLLLSQSWYAKIGPARLRLSLPTASPRARLFYSLPEHFVNSVVALVLTSLSGAAILIRSALTECHVQRTIAFLWGEPRGSINLSRSFSVHSCLLKMTMSWEVHSFFEGQSRWHKHAPYLYRKSWARPTYLQ